MVVFAPNSLATKTRVTDAKQNTWLSTNQSDVLETSQISTHIRRIDFLKHAKHNVLGRALENSHIDS